MKHGKGWTVDDAAYMVEPCLVSSSENARNTPSPSHLSWRRDNKNMPGARGSQCHAYTYITKLQANIAYARLNAKVPICEMKR